MRTEQYLLTNGAQHVKGVNTIKVYMHVSPYLTLHTIFCLWDAKLQHALRVSFSKDWPLLAAPPVSFMWFSILCDYRFQLQRLQFARLDRARLEGFPN